MRLVRCLLYLLEIKLNYTPQSQAVRTLKYIPLNQLITAHLIPERYDEFQYIFFI